MNTRKSVVLFAGLLSLAGSALAADPSTPVIDKRAANQQRRIDAGVASGQLNEREAGRLQARENKLQGDIAAAKSDGVVTGNERRGLRREERRDSRAIARQKHDGQHR